MTRFILGFIRFYQRVLSPIFYYLRPYSGCRFSPTCSEYSHSAVEKFGIIKGGWMAIKRICRCNPLSKGGHDPI